MKTNYELRYAAHPEDARHYDTQRLRRDFLIEKLFVADEVQMVYSMYDRMVVVQVNIRRYTGYGRTLLIYNND